MNNERRMDERFLLHTPVEITGVDDSGLQFVAPKVRHYITIPPEPPESNNAHLAPSVLTPPGIANLPIGVFHDAIQLDGLPRRIPMVIPVALVVILRPPCPIPCHRCRR
jgi:hypothetical protein